MKDWKEYYRQDHGHDESRGYLVYNETIFDHFKNPLYGGEMEDPDGVAFVGDPSCGDHIHLHLQRQDDKIADIRYKVFGCAAAIATTNILSELARVMSLEDALVITDDDVIETAGRIPARKAHCSLLGVTGLQAALTDYVIKKEQGKQ